MAIGDGWVNNSWVDAGWVTAAAPGGAWAVGAAALVQTYIPRYRRRIRSILAPLALIAEWIRNASN